MITHQIALVAEKVPALDAAALARAAAAIQTQITRDFMPIWGIRSNVTPFPTLSDIPLGHWPVIVADHLDDPTAGGYHLDSKNQPYAMVLYDESWTLAASHETLEMLVDPSGNHLVPGPSIDPNHSDDRVRYLLEVCDPCEDSKYSYTINGVVVSDFITPNYHDPEGTTGARYSFSGAITQPRQILDGGYISFEDPTQGDWFQGFEAKGKLSIQSIGPIEGKRSLRECVNERTPSSPTKSYHKAAANVQRAGRLYAGGSRSSEANAKLLREWIAKPR